MLAVVGDYVTSSNSIMSLPIYDNTTVTSASWESGERDYCWIPASLRPTGERDGSLNVTVMNVAGCGNGVSSSARAVTGSSPVPIRLVTPP
jgi:hypothetical protein